jgi:hypothetical protein
MYFVNQKFRPPKLLDTKSWDVAVYLISHGFNYYTIRDEHGMPVEYPTTLDNAKSFVAKYRSQSAIRIARRKHEIERRIADIARRLKNDERDRLVRELTSQLSKLG